MSFTIQAKNKALILEAFDTLLNKPDYAAALRFWSPNYIQHGAQKVEGKLTWPNYRPLFRDGEEAWQRSSNSH